MPARDSHPIGAPCWVDLTTSDAGRARDFYSQLFGWEAEEPSAEHGGYFNFRKNGVRVAGCMPKQPGMDAPDAWSIHLTTDDAAKTVEAAAQHGGQVVVSPMAVADLGTMSVVIDPSGAAVGGWQPGTHHGFGIVTEAGAPSWFELHTRDYAKAIDFYRDVFRWDTETMSDTDEFRYTTLVHGGEQLAGIMDASAFLPEGVPSHWSVYFGSDDTDASLDTIASLGGSVVQSAEDTPYGRLATAADPTGALFKLVAPNDQMPARS